VPPILMSAMLGIVSQSCERRDVGKAFEDPGPVVVRLNGNPLYRRDFETYLPEDYERVLTVEERKSYLDRWVATQLLYDEAVARGMDVSREIESRIEQLKRDLVADRLVQEVVSAEAVVTTTEVREYYEARLHEYTKEYRVSHILTNTLEDAADVKDQLQKRTFSWVERRQSLDKHTGVGGDLGFLSKGNMIPEFEAVVFRMEAGEVSEIIASDFGYHIIKLTAVRDRRNRLEYDDAAEDISRILMLEKRASVYAGLIAKLRAVANIEIVDPELKLMIEAADTSGVQN